MNKELHDYLEKDTLLFITYVVKRIGRKTIWGRILQIIDDEQKLLVYDVDNKKVEQISLYQIDDIRV